MICIYFENDLNFIDKEFKDPSSKQRAHSSPAGFFLILRLFSNVGYIVIQLTTLMDDEFMENYVTGRTLMTMMIIILVCEYLQLFLWFQTVKQIGRFISAIVNILYLDLIGFAAVFLIILFAFSYCFLLLTTGTEMDYSWATMFYALYELSVGTGEVFQEYLIELEESTQLEEHSIDIFQLNFARIMYGIYITIALVILLNLLIAVMSETSISLAKEMRNRELSIKLSSVSIVRRRIRAVLDCGRYLLCLSCCDRVKYYGMIGRTGEDLNILDGRKCTNENSLRRVSSRKITVSAQRNWDKHISAYYKEMRYLPVLENEPGKCGKMKLKARLKLLLENILEHESLDDVKSDHMNVLSKDVVELGQIQSISVGKLENERKEILPAVLDEVHFCE